MSGNQVSNQGDVTYTQLTTGKFPIPKAPPGRWTHAQYATLMMALLAAMNAAKCEPAFRATSEHDLDETSEASNVSDDQKKALKRNSDAVGILTVCFATNSGMMSILARTIVNPQWPHGRAWMVYDRLTKKYEKTNIVAETQQERMLNNITMKAHEDPGAIFQEIYTINMYFTRSGLSMSDKGMMTKAHSKLPLDLCGDAIKTAQLDWKVDHRNDPMTVNFIEVCNYRSL